MLIQTLLHNLRTLQVSAAEVCMLQPRLDELSLLKVGACEECTLKRDTGEDKPALPFLFLPPAFLRTTADHLQTLGPDHPHTVTARANLEGIRRELEYLV